MALQAKGTLEILVKWELAPMYSTAEIIFVGMKNKSLSRMVNVKQRAHPMMKAMI